MRHAFVFSAWVGALLAQCVGGFRPSLLKRPSGWIIGTPQQAPPQSSSSPHGGVGGNVGSSFTSSSSTGLHNRWTPLIEGRGASSVFPTRFRLETDELLPFTAGGGVFPADMDLSVRRGPGGVPRLLVLGMDDEEGGMIMGSSSSSSSSNRRGAAAPSILASIMTPPPTPQPMQDFNQPNNFTLNVGRALDVLRLDVPLGFDKEPDLSIYTDDIRFRDDSRIYSQGKFMYQMLFFSLRLARVFMPMPPIVEVLSMRWCEQQQCIYVRFQIRVDTLADQLYFDAVSLYRVNSEGLIYEHLIEKVIRNDLFDRITVVPLFMLQQQGRLATPAPDTI